MSPFRFPFAILGFLGLVMVVPAWLHFTGEYASGLGVAGEFLTGLLLPATAVLFVASWVDGG